MDEQKIRRYLNVVCDDIDGCFDPGTGIGDTITVARFTLNEVQKAVDLLVAIGSHNGSVRIELEEFCE